MREDAFDYGFTDGEPMEVLRSTVTAFINAKGPIDIPNTAEDWQIYSEKQESEKVAQRLGRDLRELLAELLKTPLKELPETLSALGVQLYIGKE